MKNILKDFTPDVLIMSIFVIAFYEVNFILWVFHYGLHLMSHKQLVLCLHMMFSIIACGFIASLTNHSLLDRIVSCVLAVSMISFLCWY